MITKKIRVCVLLFLLLIFTLPAMAQTYSGGNGTEKSPYLISTVADLQALATAVNDGKDYRDFYFKLTTDLDLKSVCYKVDGTPENDKSWIPIGESNYFYGFFDGAGYSISNLYINVPNGGYLGLFGSIGLETIVKNLSLVNVDIKGYAYIGGLAGTANSASIQNCFVSGRISGHAIIGGVLGESYGSIVENSINTASISGFTSVGGVVGDNTYGNMEYSINTGSVRGSISVGGLAGDGYSDSFLFCYYDKQMAPVGGFKGKEEEGSAEGKLTSEMTNGSLFGTNSNWSEASGRYPIPKVLDNNQTAKIASLLILLNNSEAVDNVKTNFSVAKVEGITWSVSGEASIDENNNVTLIADKIGDIELTAKDASSNVMKTVPLVVQNTPSTALEISSVNDLILFREAINNNGTYKNVKINNAGKGLFFKLTADLDLSSVFGPNVNGKEENWIPIGKWTKDLSSSFKGTFDGAGHSISHLYINLSDSDYQGLFGVIDVQGEVKNLSLINVDINADSYIGSVASINYGLIQNCSSNGILKGIYSNIGGMVGANSGSIKNVYSSGTFKGNDEVGGVAGSNTGVIQNALNTGSVKGSVRYLGCIVGDGNYQGSISNSYYDKQMCILGGVEGSDILNSAEGKLTSEITSGLFFSNNTDWSEESARYPIPKGLENNDAAILAATPIFFNFTNSDLYEKSYSVKSNFTLGNASGVTWTSSNTAFAEIKSKEVSLKKEGATVLTASKGSATKTINLTSAFTINSLEDFLAFRNALLSKSNPFKEVTLIENAFGLYFTLTTDIDLKGINWNETKEQGVYFSGILDGAGHSIKNLYINGANSNSEGLFYAISTGGVIKNLNLVDVDIIGLSDDVGGFAGELSRGVIENCIISGKINGKFFVGGIVGFNNFGSIKNCTNNSHVSGSRSIGGIAGGTYGSISNSVNTGDVKGDTTVGGLAGYSMDTIQYAINSGTVSGLERIGGVVGYADRFSFTEYTINHGSVIGEDRFVGCVIGYDVVHYYDGSYLSNYYDKEMCFVGGINGVDSVGNAEGKLTSEMMGTSLKTGETGDGFTEDHWIFTKDMYPRIKAIAENPVSIKNIKGAPNLTFSIYPNPAVDYIQIRGDFAEGSKLLIYDFIGRIVKQQELTPHSSTLIPVLDLSRGNYFVKVVQRNGVVRTAKLVKK